MGTSLLTEKGAQGTRVIGATGLNNRTGEFMVFKAKATIISTAGAGSIWLLSTELGGYSNMMSRAISGDGTVMAWRAGAGLTKMESTGTLRIATGLKHKWYTGAGDASYENVPIVDANGKRLPYPIQGWEDAGIMVPAPGVEEKIREGILKGEYALPFYGDWPSMPDVERRATWNLMLGEESTTKVIIDTFNKAGFDPAGTCSRLTNSSRELVCPSGRKPVMAAVVLVDWDLKTTLRRAVCCRYSDVCTGGPQLCGSHRAGMPGEKRQLMPNRSLKQNRTRSKLGVKRTGSMLRSDATAESNGKRYMQALPG